MNRAELLAVLKTAEPAVASKALYPVLENYCFSGKHVFAYDDTLGMKVPVSPGLAGCLPGKALLGMLAGSGAAEIETTSLEGKLQLKMGRSKVELSHMPAESFFERFAEPDLKEAQRVPCSEELLRGLDRASVSLGWDSLQHWAFGVTLVASKKDAVLYATNNFSICCVRTVLDQKATVQVLLPPRFVEQALRRRKSDKATFLLVWDDCVGMEYESGAVMYCRTTPEAEPDKYVALLDGMRVQTTCEIPKTLQGSLTRAKVLLSSPVLAERTATFRTAKDRLYVEVTTDRGTMRDVHKLPGHEDLQLKAPPELIEAALPYAERIAFLEGKAVRMEGDGFEYVIAASA